jgi:hypothetical protein
MNINKEIFLIIAFSSSSQKIISFEKEQDEHFFKIFTSYCKNEKQTVQCDFSHQYRIYFYP